MKRNAYSAGAVSYSFWFMEFRKVVQLLSEGRTFEEIKELNKKSNIFGARSPYNAERIYRVVAARIKALDSSFYPLFLDSDVSTQKLFALAGALAHDTLFFDFVYEVVREKMIIGANELSDADIRIFFRDKQTQDEKVASFTDGTLMRLQASYKTHLYEAGLLEDKTKASVRKIYRPILDPVLKHWLDDYDYVQIAKSLEGVR